MTSHQKQHSNSEEFKGCVPHRASRALNVSHAGDQEVPNNIV